MRITIIGGKGHVGTYLVPRLLVGAGFMVTAVSRGQRVRLISRTACGWRCAR